MARSKGSAKVVSDEAEEILNDLEDEEEGDEPSTEQDIEKKYDEGQARIVIQRNDFLVPNLLQMFKDREILDMTPPYQRRSRWSDKRRSLLIESLLMNIPIPPIFLYERAYAQYEVMDGQQRLTAIRSFLGNEFKLRGLKLWKELNRKDYRDLPPKIQKGLERRGIAAVIILTESGKDDRASIELRQAVFERLNTGGERLNAQEVRNCLYASRFNDTLIRLARSDQFTTAWEIPAKESGEPVKVSRKLEKHPLYSKMADVEIVLRYFALCEMEAYRGGMKKSLDQCMIRGQDMSEKDCKNLEEDYLRILSLAMDIYKTHLFRLPKNGDGLLGRRSVPLADAVLLATKAHSSQAESLRRYSSRIISGTSAALHDRESRNVLVGRGNTKKDVESRIDLMKEVFSRAIR
jgi:hypothetical protein